MENEHEIARLRGALENVKAYLHTLGDDLPITKFVDGVLAVDLAKYKVEDEEEETIEEQVFRNVLLTRAEIEFMCLALSAIGGESEQGVKINAILTAHLDEEE